MYKVPDKELIRKLEEVRLRGRKRWIFVNYLKAKNI